MSGTITVKPGETIQIIGVPADSVLPPYIWGPTDPRPTHPIAGPGRPPWWGMANDPGYSPPWATPGPGGPVDPGYSPPWAQVPGGGTGIWGPGDPRPTNPIANPGNPAWPGGAPRPDQGLPPFPNHPIVIPPTEPPPVQPPTDGEDGNWVWAWSPQAGRWVWVKVPGEGEAGPKV